MANNISLNIVANAQFQQVYAEVTKLKEAMASLQKVSVGGPFTPEATASIRSAQKAFDDAVLSTRAFTVQHVAMTDAVTKFGKQLDAGKLSLNQYYKIWRDSSKGISSELDALATQQARLNRSIAIADPLRPGYAKLVTDINGVVTSQEKATFYQKALNTALHDGSMKLIDFGKNTQWMGRQLTVGLTMPMALFGSTAANTFLQVDKELTRLQKVYGTGLVQPTKEALNSIRADVTALGTELASTLGISVKETAAMAADLAATGLEGQKLINATRESLRLATLGELDHQQAMTATVSLQNVYKLSTQGLSEAVNFLNAVENQTSTSLQDLVDAIPRVGPIVQQLGGSFKDTAAMMVAMKEAGVPAAQGANAIKSALSSLISPTKNAQNAFAAYGISLSSIAKSTGGNPVAMFKMLSDQMQKLDNLSKAKLIENLFGKFQFARVSALLDNINKVGSQTQTVFNLMGASTQDLASLAANELKQQTESASGRFKRMTETIKADMLPLGQSFLNMFSTLGNVVDKILKVFQGLGHILGPVAGMFKGIFGTGLIGALVIGPILMLTGLMANLVGNILKGANYIRMFRQGMAEALPTENAFLSGIRAMRNFYEDLDLGMVAARNQMELMPEAITSNAVAFDVLRKSIFDLTTQFQALAAAQAESMGAGLVRGPIGKTGFGQMRLPGFAGGGYIPGTGNSDSYPAMLTPGEAVIPKGPAQKYQAFISGMINGTLPGFNGGLINGDGYLTNVTGTHSLIMDRMSRMSAPPANAFTDSSIVKGWGNATMYLPQRLNDLMKEGGAGVSASVLTKQIESQGSATFAPLLAAVARELGISIKEFSPQFQQLAAQLANQTVSSLREAGEKIVKDDWIGQNVVPKLKEIASEVEIAGKNVGVGLDSAVNAIRTAGVVGVGSGAGGGAGRLQIKGDSARGGAVSYKSLTEAQGLAEEWQALDNASQQVFQSQARYSESRKKMINEFRVLDQETGNYEIAAKSHLTGAINMTFKEMQANVEQLGGNVKNFISSFTTRFKKEYAAGVAEATKSASPSKEGIQAGKNMGDGLVKGVNDPKIIAQAEQAGAILGGAEVAGMRMVAAEQMAIPGIGGLGNSKMSYLDFQEAQGPVQSMSMLSRMKGSPYALPGAMMLGSMGVNALPNKIGGQSLSGFKNIFSSALGAGSMAAFIPGVGPELALGIAGGVAALQTGIKVFQILQDKEKQHAEIVKTTFSQSTQAISMFNKELYKTAGASALDIAGLKSDDPFKKFANSLKGMSKADATSAITSFSSAQVVAGMDPARVEKMAAALLTYAGYSKDLDQSLKSIISSTKDLSTATATYTSKLAAQSTEGDKNVTRYKDLSSGGKLYADSLYQIQSALASGKIPASDLSSVIEGLTSKTKDAVKEFDLLRIAAENAGNTKMVALLDAVRGIAGATKASIGAVSALNTLSSAGVDITTILAGAKTPEDLTNKLKNVTYITGLLKDAQKAQLAAYNKQYGTTASTSAVDGLNAQIKKLKEQKKVIDDQVKSEEAKLALIQKQNDYLNKQTDLTQQIKEAEIKGEYLKAAQLKAQQQYNTVQYKTQAGIDSQKAEADAIQTKIDDLTQQVSDIQAAADKTAAAAAKTAAATQLLTSDKIAEIVKGILKGLGINPNPTYATDTPKGDSRYSPTASRLVPQFNDTKSAAAAYNSKDVNKKRVKVYNKDTKMDVQYDLVMDPNGLYYWVSELTGTRYPAVKGLATGGLIKGSGTWTSDSILTRLSNGEYVVKADAVAKYGTGFMNAINSKTYAGNGLSSYGISGSSSSTVGGVNYNIDLTINASGITDPKQLEANIRNGVLNAIKVSEAKNNKTNGMGARI